jgi:hypothetical protein
LNYHPLTHFTIFIPLTPSPNPYTKLLYNGDVFKSSKLHDVLAIINMKPELWVAASGREGLLGTHMYVIYVCLLEFIQHTYIYMSIYMHMYWTTKGLWVYIYIYVFYIIIYMFMNWRYTWINVNIHIYLMYILQAKRGLLRYMYAS